MAYLNRTEIDATYPPETVFGYIYLWTNKINGKQYVGQTINLEQREYQHIHMNVDTLIHKAITKYGENNFERVVLDVALNENELNEKEMYWINTLDTYKNGYNSTLGGKGISVETNKHHNFTNKYYAIQDVFGNFYGCFEGVCNTAKNLSYLSDNELTFKQCSSAIEGRNKGVISFDTPYDKFIITNITSDDYILYSKAQINPVNDIFLSSKQTYETDLTSIEVEEFKNTLTEKQLHVLNGILDGKTQKELAKEMCVTQPQICRILKSIQKNWIQIN